jgi:Domain of unknown function (DUF397)
MSGSVWRKSTHSGNQEGDCVEVVVTDVTEPTR